MSDKETMLLNFCYAIKKLNELPTKDYEASKHYIEDRAKAIDKYIDYVNKEAREGCQHAYSIQPSYMMTLDGKGAETDEIVLVCSNCHKVIGNIKYKDIENSKKEVLNSWKESKWEEKSSIKILWFHMTWIIGKTRETKHIVDIRTILKTKSQIVFLKRH
ncbi:MAG: hypothetical protein GY679_01495 [Mycoplasma sp.]|nr:hypothetical protein [Mycoplasma sp.]